MSYIRANKESIIRWLKMIQVKDCSRNTCPCADKLRRLLVIRPKTNYDEININQQIKAQEIKYNKCSKN
jgi:hypothetical protein